VGYFLSIASNFIAVMDGLDMKTPSVAWTSLEHLSCEQYYMEYIKVFEN
jgi:hypothetical protein